MFTTHESLLAVVMTCTNTGTNCYNYCQNMMWYTFQLDPKITVKLAKIMADICENREIHGKIAASTIKSEYGSEATIANI